MFIRAKQFVKRKLKSVARISILPAVRSEYTVLPRFAYHQPLDYELETRPPDFEAPVVVAGEALPVPPSYDRYGYCPDDPQAYLRWGLKDHDLLMQVIASYRGVDSGLRLLDFGCSSGRVLRHFEKEHESLGWVLHGVDVQARPIEWMRQHFPQHFQVYTGSVMPHLPFADSSLDVIYGFSVFTHIKYLWDAWLLELKRALRPGGILIQTIHAERAWQHYHRDRDKEYVRSNLPEGMLAKSEMDLDFFYYGDIAVSQVFWKREIARKYWGRYFDVLEVRDPPENSFQDWIICRKR